MRRKARGRTKAAILEGGNMRVKFSVFDGSLSSLDVYCGALKPRAEVVSAGGRRPGRRIFIAPSQVEGRRDGYKLRRRTAVAVSFYAASDFGAACFLCGARHRTT